MSPDTHKPLTDKERWESIYRQYYQLLCFFAYSYVKDTAIAEDIVQSVFAKMLDVDIEGMDRPHLRSFLYRSVKNLCINELRSTALHDHILESIGSEDKKLYQDDSLFHNIVRAEVYKQILDAVNQLPEKTAEVFKLAYFEQKSNPEISEEMDISINTVKVHKNNAKKQLRIYLKDVYPTAIPLFLALIEIN